MNDILRGLFLSEAVSRHVERSPGLIEQLRGAPSARVEVPGGYATWDTMMKDAFELDVALVEAVRNAVAVLRPEERSTIEKLAPGLLTVREARRIAGVLRFCDAKTLREAVTPHLPGRDSKQLSTALKIIKTRFGECALHHRGAWLELAEPAQKVEKAPSRLSLLEAENARLRALLEKHGIPDR